MKARRAIATALAVGLVAVAFAGPAEAGKKKKKPKRVERQAEGDYAPSLILFRSCSGGMGCVVLPTRLGEYYVTAKVSDTHGQPVYVDVAVLPPGTNQFETYGSFCGETSEPLLVPEGTPLHFFVGYPFFNTGLVCVPGFATSGTIAVTFSNLP